MKINTYLSLVIIALILASDCVATSNSNHGSIIINSEPNGAEISLNNTYKGTTPNVIDTLAPGTYNIELRVRDYQTYSEVIVVNPHDTHHLSITLIPTTQQTQQHQVTSSTQTSLSTQSSITPLLIVVKGDQSYSTNDVVRFSGIGPKGQFVSLSLTESSGVTFDTFNATQIANDGTWLYDYDLKSIPIAPGVCTVKAYIFSTNTMFRPESATVQINLTP